MGGVHLLRDQQKIRPINRDNQTVRAVNLQLRQHLPLHRRSVKI